MLIIFNMPYRILFILAVTLAEEMNVEVSFIVPGDFNVSNFNETLFQTNNATFLGPLVRMLDISPILCVLGLNYTYYNCYEDANTNQDGGSVGIIIGIVVVGVMLVIVVIVVIVVIITIPSNQHQIHLGRRIMPVLIDWPPKKKTNFANGMYEAQPLTGYARSAVFEQYHVKGWFFRFLKLRKSES